MIANIIPIILATSAIVYASILAYRHVFHSCDATRCEALNIKHFIILLASMFVACVYIILEVRWIYLETYILPVQQIDSIGWIVLDSLYFALQLFALNLFEERYHCPRMVRE